MAIWGRELLSVQEALRKDDLALPALSGGRLRLTMLVESRKSYRNHLGSVGEGTEYHHVTMRSLPELMMKGPFPSGTSQADHGGSAYSWTLVQVFKKHSLEHIPASYRSESASTQY